MLTQIDDAAAETASWRDTSASVPHARGHACRHGTHMPVRFTAAYARPAAWSAASPTLVYDPNHYIMSEDIQPVEVEGQI